VLVLVVPEAVLRVVRVMWAVMVITLTSTAALAAVVLVLLVQTAVRVVAGTAAMAVLPQLQALLSPVVVVVGGHLHIPLWVLAQEVVAVAEAVVRVPTSAAVLPLALQIPAEAEVLVETVIPAVLAALA
jgi:hypothetical protein